MHLFSRRPRVTVSRMMPLIRVNSLGTGQHSISETMTGTIGLLAGGDADGVDHVRLLIKYGLYAFRELAPLPAAKPRKCNGQGCPGENSAPKNNLVAPPES
jgi:hypothetical protein